MDNGGAFPPVPEPAPGHPPRPGVPTGGVSAPAPRRRGPRLSWWQWGLVAVGAVAVVTCVISAVMASGGGSDPNADLLVYRGTVRTDAESMVNDENAVLADCGTELASACRADAQKWDGDLIKFLSDLNAHPAPLCLRSDDGTLRAGLRLFDKAMRELTQAFDQHDTALVAQFETDFRAGAADYNPAINAIIDANC